MRDLPVLLVLFLVVSAGCFTPSEPEAQETGSVEAEGVEVVEDRPDPAFQEVATGPGAAADGNATLDAPPRLRAGEWWRLRFDTPLVGSGAVEVVRVVAAVETEGYLIGMPHEGWYKEAIAYHSPAFGDVNLDLSYNTHNERFQPLKFPLVEGDTWETEFAMQPLVATVEKVEGLQATVVLRAPEGPQTPEQTLFGLLGMAQAGEVMRLVYDASVHEVVRFESGIGTYEVVDHGYDFTGWVTIPRGEHTAIDYGTFGPATPGEPVVTREIEITGGFNRMTLMHFVYPVSPGAYRVRSVGPGGTEFLTETVGGEMAIRFYEAKDPDGVWTGEDVVGGAGATYSMGIAYHQYDIRLPDGARRADHSHEVIR